MQTWEDLSCASKMLLRILMMEVIMVAHRTYSLLDCMHPFIKLIKMPTELPFKKECVAIVQPNSVWHLNCVHVEVRQINGYLRVVVCYYGTTNNRTTAVLPR